MRGIIENGLSDLIEVEDGIDQRNPPVRINFYDYLLCNIQNKTVLGFRMGARSTNDLENLLKSVGSLILMIQHGYQIPEKKCSKSLT